MKGAIHRTWQFTGSPLHLELGYPPSVNTYYRFGRGRAHINRAGRIYREDAFARLARYRRPEIAGPVLVTLDFHPPDRRIRDLDNAVKPVLDALSNCGIICNDVQVRRMVSAMHDRDRENPRVEIGIYAL